MVTEGPARQHGGPAGELGVLPQELFRSADEDVEVHAAGGRAELQAVLLRRADIEHRAVEVVEEKAIAGAAHIKRNTLVAFIVLAREGVAMEHLHLLSTLIECGALVAEAEHVLIGA